MPDAYKQIGSIPTRSEASIYRQQHEMLSCDNKPKVQSTQTKVHSVLTLLVRLNTVFYKSKEYIIVILKSL